MPAHRAVLIPGDGVGPEVIDAARRSIEATGVAVDWVLAEMGAAAFAHEGDPLPAVTLERIRECRVALKGPIETPVEAGVRSANIRLRRTLDLFANVRPCRRYPGVPSPYEHVDLVVIREGTEDLYAGVELEMGTEAVAELIAFIGATTGRTVRADSGISVKEISERGSERIVRFAFAWAQAAGRSSVTASHKANIMKFSDGLFLDVARRVAAEHPAIGFQERIIDALCMQLVQTPERFDVLVMPNTYGDLVAELGAGLIGGVGLAPGGLFGGADGRELAVFEATHGTAPRLAGTDRADPVGAILSGAMLLRHIEEAAAADALEAAVAEVLAEGAAVTPDLRAAGDDRPAVGTHAMADAVVRRLASLA
ncbi:MAG TPA: isocitrate/isopropylmalate family dehydrogenase [Actinomycetota bacterium]|nr:isocitrate/isopropylmalate family dehydrogenase [Actinomycetota bacterium]